MLSYQRINNIIGWLVFFVALAVYTLTVEPTASFWDCGEFIAVSYKLMTPHPPGAPLFLLIGRLFSLLAGGDVTKVAYWINMVSVVSSAFTILFLFWSITLVARKLVLKAGEIADTTQTILIIASGLVGALAYTFSDSFWFSAVEAEVYAMSSFFTAFVVWAILKWESVADDPYSDRWLLLIAYMVGLSIGVHLLNLVALPAIGMVIYFRRYENPTWKGGIITFLISSIVLGIIMVGVIPGLPSIAGAVEVLFVNSFGLPFNSGSLFFTLALVGALVYGIRYSIATQKKLLNLCLVAFTFILIGYASYGMILIRSNFNPPIDENNPEDVMKFVSYLKREQYGDRPLLYGPQFTAELIEQTDGAPIYAKGESKYEIVDYKPINTFDPKHETLIPRMHSRQGGHPEYYKEHMKRFGRYREGKMPTMFQNLAFLFERQIGFFYGRYFLWNFVGREGDIQDSGVLWPTDAGKKLPFQLQSKARNNYWAIPLLLGIAGLIYQLSRDQKNFLIVFLLFLFTGLAILFYVNNPPSEPRERDYVYAGSFYAFAFWIGLGVIALYDWIKSGLKTTSVALAVSILVSATAPAVMAAQGWDDHDRSKRYHSVDSAKNLLASCAKNAILFTGGDNDTFPLWYVQEVEGFRTDVRVCNLSLLNTDWYIDQMKRKAYDSDPLPISLESKNYIQGKNDVIYYYNQSGVDQPMNLDKYIEFVRTDNENVKRYTDQDRFNNYITTLPSKQLVVPVNRDEVMKNPSIPEMYKPLVVTKLDWNIKRGSLEKKDLIMLDMIVNISKDNWKRPVYFSTTLGPSNMLNLRDHMFLEGLAFRLLPVNHNNPQGVVNTSVMYNNMMKKFHWRALDDASIFYDENYQRFTFNARLQFYFLAAQLFYMEKDTVKAKNVVNECFKVMPDKAIPYDAYTSQFVGLLMDMGDKDKALEIAEVMGKRSKEMIDYIIENRIDGGDELYRQAAVLSALESAMKEHGYTKEAKLYGKWLNQLEQYN